MSGSHDPKVRVEADGTVIRRIAGVDCEVVDEATIQASDAVLCADYAPELMERFPDNVVTECADCQTPIVHRPNAPNVVKLCNLCGLLRMSGRDFALIARYPE